MDRILRRITDISGKLSSHFVGYQIAVDKYEILLKARPWITICK
jgi:hypothetical protein